LVCTHITSSDAQPDSFAQQRKFSYSVRHWPPALPEQLTISAFAHSLKASKPGQFSSLKQF
jgi:hypothetical protein